MEGVEGTSEHNPVQPPHDTGTSILQEIRVLKATSIYKDILTYVFHVEKLWKILRNDICAGGTKKLSKTLLPQLQHMTLLSLMGKNSSQCQQNCIARKK